MTIIYVGATRPITTISAGVAAAAPGDTVQVDPGYYNEVVIVNKTITLNGARSGTDARTRNFTTLDPTVESIVTFADPTGVIQVTASGVVVDGFAVHRNNTGGISAGIYTAATNSGYIIQNNILEDNSVGLSFNSQAPAPAQNVARQNLFFRNNSAATAGFGQGVWAVLGGDDFLVTENLFAGLHLQSSINFSGASNVTISHNVMRADNSIALASTTAVTVQHNIMQQTAGSAIFFGGGTADTTLSHNTLKNSLGSAIRVTEAFTPTPNSHIAGHNNNIENNATAGVNIDAGTYVGTLDLTSNYWNSPNGPSLTVPQQGKGDVIIDPNNNVTYIPFLTTAAV